MCFVLKPSTWVVFFVYLLVCFQFALYLVFPISCKADPLGVQQQLHYLHWTAVPLVTPSKTLIALQWNSLVLGLKHKTVLSTYKADGFSISVLAIFLFPASSFHTCCWHPPASWGISLPTAFGLHWKRKTTPTFTGRILPLGKKLSNANSLSRLSSLRS